MHFKGKHRKPPERGKRSSTQWRGEAKEKILDHLTGGDYGFSPFSQAAAPNYRSYTENITSNLTIARFQVLGHTIITGRTLKTLLVISPSDPFVRSARFRVLGHTIRLVFRIGR